MEYLAGVAIEACLDSKAAPAVIFEGKIRAKGLKTPFK